MTIKISLLQFYGLSKFGLANSLIFECLVTAFAYNILSFFSTKQLGQLFSERNLNYISQINTNCQKLFQLFKLLLNLDNSMYTINCKSPPLIHPSQSLSASQTGKIEIERVVRQQRRGDRRRQEEELDQILRNIQKRLKQRAKQFDKLAQTYNQYVISSSRSNSRLSNQMQNIKNHLVQMNRDVDRLNSELRQDNKKNIPIYQHCRDYMDEQLGISKIRQLQDKMDETKLNRPISGHKKYNQANYYSINDSHKFNNHYKANDYNIGNSSSYQKHKIKSESLLKSKLKQRRQSAARFSHQIQNKDFFNSSRIFSGNQFNKKTSTNTNTKSCRLSAELFSQVSKKCNPHKANDKKLEYIANKLKKTEGTLKKTRNKNKGSNKKDTEQDLRRCTLKAVNSYGLDLGETQLKSCKVRKREGKIRVNYVPKSRKSQSGRGGRRPFDGYQPQIK